MGLGAGLDMEAERKKKTLPCPYPCRNSNPGRLVRIPVVALTEKPWKDQS